MELKGTKRRCEDWDVMNGYRLLDDLTGLRYMLYPFERQHWELACFLFLFP